MGMKPHDSSYFVARIDRTDVPKLVAGGQIFRSGGREAQRVLSKLPRIWLLKRYVIGK